MSKDITTLQNEANATLTRPVHYSLEDLAPFEYTLGAVFEAAGEVSFTSFLAESSYTEEEHKNFQALPETAEVILIAVYGMNLVFWYPTLAVKIRLTIEDNQTFGLFLPTFLPKTKNEFTEKQRRLAVTDKFMLLDATILEYKNYVWCCSELTAGETNDNNLKGKNMEFYLVAYTKDIQIYLSVNPLTCDNRMELLPLPTNSNISTNLPQLVGWALKLEIKTRPEFSYFINSWSKYRIVKILYFDQRDVPESPHYILEKFNSIEVVEQIILYQNDLAFLQINSTLNGNS